MKSKSDPTSPLILQIHEWKIYQGIVSLTIEEMKKEAKGKKLISEQKIDGQSSILDYKEGHEPKLGSLSGVITWELPLLDEIEKIFRSKNITQANIVGELAGYDDGKIIPFNKTESLIKNKNADKTKIHWFPYQILELNGKKYNNNFETYMKSWPEVLKIFKGSKYVHPVKYEKGGPEAIDKTWKEFVEKEKNEGIVVRMSDNKIYKVKPVFTYDLVIVAVGDKKKKNWPKGMIGTTLMAFMDNNGVFRTAGEIGTGWTESIRAYLYEWSQKNKVEEDDTYVWVRPKKICEVQWERSNIKDMPSYRYSHGKYEPVGKLQSGTIVKPRFIRWRTDKSVNKNDLRLTQVPDWGKKEKMARTVIAMYLKRNTEDIPTDLIKNISARIKNIFGFDMPTDVEWRTSAHPDYEKDKQDSPNKNADGFITKDWKKIYANVKINEDFIAHEIGHFFDKKLGNGKYFSHSLDLPKVPLSPHENFAIMISYVVTEGHPGGKVQSIIYKALCDKLGKSANSRRLTHVGSNYAYQ